MHHTRVDKTAEGTTMPFATRPTMGPSPVHPDRVERHEAIIIGAGQAGLATAQQLALRGIEHVVLDAAGRIGDSWRRRWDSLRLFTPAEYDELPGMPFPAPAWHFPSKDEVADYLVRYAERFAIPVRLGMRVDALRWSGDRFIVKAGGQTLEAEQVVVATGAFQRPRIPALAAEIDATIRQLHSSEYRAPHLLPDGPALVVGAGSSGAQIALELARDRQVWLAGRDTASLPRRLLGQDIFEWIWPILSYATLDTSLGRGLRDRTSRGGDSRIGVSARAITRGGVARVGRVSKALGGLPACDEGTVVEPRVIVWCTGYSSDYRWIDLPVLDERGEPRHRRGVSVDVPGLHFVGLRFQYRLVSSSIGGVGSDAAYVAAAVARRVVRRGVA